jgi:alkanesulfonate monooxygenase SsuD/methylene tetrahydromethanopterin reductase-like flavin-dependent oxidoreductase (luciferase family)
MSDRTRLALSGIVLSDRHPAAFVADVRRAEQMGLRTLWTYDHLIWDGVAGGAWHASVPLVAAAAGATVRMRLGFQVATPNFRHPVPFAHELLTLDALSGGRIDVGIGAGTAAGDSRATGAPPTSGAARTARFAEWSRLLDALLTGPVPDHTGEHYAAAATDLTRGHGADAPRSRLPFTVAAAGPRGMAVAARLGDAWVTYGRCGTGTDPAAAWFETLADQAATVDRMLAEHGRPRTSLRRIAMLALDAAWPFGSTARYQDTVGRLVELGFDEISVHLPRPDGRGMPEAMRDVVADVHGGVPGMRALNLGSRGPGKRSARWPPSIDRRGLAISTDVEGLDRSVGATPTRGRPALGMSQLR